MTKEVILLHFETIECTCLLIRVSRTVSTDTFTPCMLLSNVVGSLNFQRISSSDKRVDPGFLEVSFRPNYFIFIGYLKTGWGWGREGAQANPMNSSGSTTAD